MQLRRGRADVLQVAEDAPSIEHREDFGIKRALPLVHQMVNGEAGDDRVEFAQRRQRVIKIVGHNRDRGIRREALASGLEHSRGKVDGNRFHLGQGIASALADQCRLHTSEQPAVAGAQIEHPLRGGGKEFEKRGFALAAVRNGIGPFQVIAGVLGGRS